MKGVELPINVMIIIVLAIVVLIAIVVLFTGTVSPTSNSLQTEAAKNNACNIFRSNGCQNADDVLVSGVSGSTTLQELCTNKYFNPDCAVVCNCMGAAASCNDPTATPTDPSGCHAGTNTCPPSYPNCRLNIVSCQYTCKA